MNMGETMIDIEQEFLNIVRDYQGIIRKVSYLYFKQRDDREDNFQDVLYQLWKSYDSLREKEKIGSWIYSVAIFTSISKIRKVSRMRFEPDIPDIASDEDLESLFIRQESRQLLHTAIRSLGEIDRALILLHLEEKEYAEIAEILGMTKSNVGVRLMRIKEQLSSIIKKG
jgi:RNA polymerase sigma-70 factor, ECF subfamily